MIKKNNMRKANGLSKEEWLTIKRIKEKLEAERKFTSLIEVNILGD